MKRTGFSIVLAVLLLIGPSWADELQDGFYTMVRRDVREEIVLPLSAGEVLAVNDPAMLGNDPDEELIYVVLKEEPFVPILLKEAPSKTPDTTERTQFWLGISLNDEAAAQFEDFTRQNLGGTVAIVVGGKVITMHQIKDVIKGGKIQISRCGDKGCSVLFRELSDNLDAK